ncbi:hypothetical protein K7432_005696 [Basidiobolus ranarum]|uniref:Uncharacterized protein n=1 Tax=Basidiobolus ranarum TaxID=34480 RepID=A0ABR2WW79_9FUNG
MNCYSDKEGELFIEPNLYEIRVGCQELPKLDFLSESDPQVVLFAKGGHNQERWVEIGRTETLWNAPNPKFAQSFLLEYESDKIQYLRFEVYDKDSDVQDIHEATIIGSTEITFQQIISTPTLVKSLVNPKLGNQGKFEFLTRKVPSFKHRLTFQFNASELERQTMFMNNDPFFTVSAQRHNGDWVLVYRSETCSSTHTPQWEAFAGPLSRFTDDEHNGKLLIQVYDYRRNGHALIGEIQTTIQGLIGAKGKRLALVNEFKENPSLGYLHIAEFSVERKFNFYEYIVGGAHINLSVAIDLSSSNGDPKNPQSLHYQNPRESNEYQKAILNLGNILERYDKDKHFPVFGFGTKSNDINPSHFVTLSEKALGIKGILDTYAEAFLTVQPSEPTYFAQVIDEACNRLEYELAQARRNSSYIQNYHALLIITDGRIDDMEKTIASIIRASELPLSIIIAGVGVNDFSNMEMLDSDEKLLSLNGKTAKRDIVQFVPLHEFQGLNSHRLTRAVLTEIPDQFMEYMNNQQIPPPKQRMH